MTAAKAHVADEPERLKDVVREVGERIMAQAEIANELLERIAVALEGMRQEMRDRA